MLAKLSSRLHLQVGRRATTPAFSRLHTGASRVGFSLGKCRNGFLSTQSLSTMTSTSVTLPIQSMNPRAWGINICFRQFSTVPPGGEGSDSTSPTKQSPSSIVDSTNKDDGILSGPPSDLDITLNGAWEASQVGDFDKAERLFRAALAEQEATIGPSHPDTLLSLSNLGGILLDMGKSSDAEPIIRLALERRTKVLGPDHQSTLTSANNLALCLKMQNRLEDAEPLAKQAFVGSMVMLGPTHEDSLDSAINFSEILAMQEKLEESKRILRQLFDACERAYGLKDARTMTLATHLSTIQDMIDRE